MLKTKQKRCKSKRRRIREQRESSCLSCKDSSFFSKASVETSKPRSSFRESSRLYNQSTLRNPKIQERSQTNPENDRRREAREQNHMNQNAILSLSLYFFRDFSSSLFLLLLRLSSLIYKLLFVYNNFPGRFISVKRESA